MSAQCKNVTCHLCCSLFILSNETVNIWSHLLGFCLFFALGVYDLLAVLPTLGASREDYVIYSIGLFCFQVCQCSFGRCKMSDGYISLCNRVCFLDRGHLSDKNRTWIGTSNTWSLEFLMGYFPHSLSPEWKEYIRFCRLLNLAQSNSRSVTGCYHATGNRQKEAAFILGSHSQTLGLDEVSSLILSQKCNYWIVWLADCLILVNNVSPCYRLDVNAVFCGLSPVLLSPLRKDQPPLDGVGLRWHLHWNHRLLRSRSVLRFLLQ